MVIVTYMASQPRPTKAAFVFANPKAKLLDQVREVLRRFKDHAIRIKLTGPISKTEHSCKPMALILVSPMVWTERSRRKRISFIFLTPFF